MKRSKSHKIDEKGSRVFEDSLPENWVANPQSKDYGKDYLIEIGSDSEALSGEAFYVQLKSKAKAKLSSSGEYISFSLETRHARYYSKIKDLPVFLVVSDIATKTCWYVFLQPILRNDQSWKHKRQIAIRIPAANVISDHKSLLREVTEAKSWLQARYPSSIFNAVKAKEQNLQDIDSRFKPNVSYANGKVNILMSPREDVRFSLKLANEVARKKFADVVELGKPSVFESSEISISGSKLFEIFPPAKIEMHPQQNSGTLQFSDQASLSESRFRSHEFHAAVTGGTKRLTFTSAVEKSPLEVKVTLDFEKKESPILRIGFDPSVWEGVPIRRLPYFLPAIEIFSYLSKNSSFYLQFLKDGNTLASEFVEELNAEATLPIHQLLTDIHKAKRICEKHDADPVWDFNEFCRLGVTLDQCYELLENGSWQGNCPGAEITGQLVKSDEFPKISGKDLKDQHLLLTSDMWFELLGEKIFLGRVAQEFSEMTVVKVGKSNSAKRPNKKRKKAVGHESEQSVPFVFRASKNCTLTMRFAKDGE